ncbi:hypothetical protein KY327_01425 [Candidatus Woesearchaeota archaeon]|nr:hypothetical protein [Candidatus Woesearchaeota archaeon]
MDAHEREKYARYNRRLLRSLQHFYNQRLDTIKKADVESKKEFVTSLKDVLDKAAVIKRRMPRKYVPMRRVFKRLYDDLYGGKGSYLSALESGDENAVEKAEERVLHRMEKSMRHLKPPSGLDKEGVEELYREVGRQARHKARAKSSSPFARTAALIAVFLVMSSFTPVIAQTVEKSFTTDEKKTSMFEEIKQDIKGVVGSVINLAETGSDGVSGRMHLVREAGDVDEETRTSLAERRAEVVAWADDLNLLDKDFVGKILDQDAVNAGQALANTWKKHLPKGYKVGVKTFDSAKDSIKVPLEYRPVEELKGRLARDQTSLEKDVRWGPETSVRRVKEIFLGLNEDEEFVFVIREHVTSQKDDDSRTQTRQVNVVVSPRD